MKQDVNSQSFVTTTIHDNDATAGFSEMKIEKIRWFSLFPNTSLLKENCRTEIDSRTDCFDEKRFCSETVLSH